MLRSSALWDEHPSATWQIPPSQPGPDSFGRDPDGGYRALRRLCSTACYGWVVTETISQRELRNDSGRIMRQLDAGRSFVVTRHAVPVGELRPLRRHRLIDRAVVTAIFRAAPAIDRQRFVEDLDAATDQGIDPRA